MKAEGDFGIIAGIVTDMSLSLLDAIPDYAPAAAKDIQINGR